MCTLRKQSQQGVALCIVGSSDFTATPPRTLFIIIFHHHPSIKQFHHCIIIFHYHMHHPLHYQKIPSRKSIIASSLFTIICTIVCTNKNSIKKIHHCIIIFHHHLHYQENPSQHHHSFPSIFFITTKGIFNGR